MVRFRRYRSTLSIGVAGMSARLPARGQCRHTVSLCGRAQQQGWAPRASATAAPAPVYDRLQEWLISEKSLAPQKLEVVQREEPCFGSVASCSALEDIPANEVSARACCLPVSTHAVMRHWRWRLQRLACCAATAPRFLDVQPAKHFRQHWKDELHSL